MIGTRKQPPEDSFGPVPDNVANLETRPLPAAAIMSVRELCYEKINAEQKRRDRAPDRAVMDFCLEIISRLRGL